MSCSFKFRATSFAWNSDSELAAVADTNGTVVLRIDSGNATEKPVVNLPGSGINALTFSSDGQHLASIGDGGLIQVWHVAELTNGSTPELKTKTVGEADYVAIAADPTGTQFAGGSEDGGVVVGDSDADWKLLQGSHRDSVNDIAFSPDGTRLASVSDDKSVRVWQREGDGTFGTSPMVLVRHKERIRSLTFTRDGNSLLTVSDDATAIVWPLDSDALEKNVTLLVGHESAIHAGEFSNDGGWVITGSDDGTVRLWNLQSDNPSASVVIMHQFDEPVRAIALVDESKTLIAGTRNGELFIWPLDPAELLKSVRLSAGRTLSAGEIQQFDTMTVGRDE